MKILRACFSFPLSKILFTSVSHSTAVEAWDANAVVLSVLIVFSCASKAILWRAVGSQMIKFSLARVIAVII